MKDLGEAFVFLGLEIQRNRTLRSLHLSQPSYTLEILSRFGMPEEKLPQPPMIVNLQQSLQDKSTPIYNIPYRQAISSLIYLMTGTRPYISFSVGWLAQFQENPSLEHWTAVKRNFRYLSGTRSFEISYNGHYSSDIIGYSDSDWAGCLSSRRSTRGYIFLIAGGSVTWRSKKQTIVSTSSCEAEYVTSYLAAQESTWISRVLLTLRNHTSAPPIQLLLDNQGSIYISETESINQRNKHIEIKFYYIRDQVRLGAITLHYCPTDYMSSDTMKTSLSRFKFEYHREAICLRPSPIILTPIAGAC